MADITKEESVHLVQAKRLTEQTPSQMPLFDSEVLGSLKNGLGKDQMIELMKSFYEKADSLILTAEQSAHANNVKALTATGHDLAGMSSNFGFTALGDAARKINRLGRDGGAILTMAPLVAQLRPLYTESRTVVDEWMAK
jgi:HPt (histidine-containing phosphotransfer) domain-containing protein